MSLQVIERQEIEKFFGASLRNGSVNCWVDCEVDSQATIGIVSLSISEVNEGTQDYETLHA